MAITPEGFIGEAQEKTSDTGLLFTAVEDIPVGNLCVVSYSVDNAATAEGETTGSKLGTITDESGNTWTHREYAMSEGAENDGSQVGVAWSVITTQIDSGDDVILTLGSARTAKVMAGAHWSFTEDGLELAGVAFAGDANTELVSVALADLPSPAELWIAVLGIEGDALTAAIDTDYTLIADIGTTGGGQETNQTLFLSYRINSATAETVNSDINSAQRETAQILLAFREVSDGGPPTHALASSLSVTAQIDNNMTRVAQLAAYLGLTAQIDSAMRQTHKMGLELVVGAGVDTVMRRITFLATELGINTGIATDLTRVAALAADMGVTAQIDSDLTVTGGGPSTHDLASSLDIVLAIDSHMTRIATLAADFGASLGIDSAMTRTAKLALSLDAAAHVDTQLTRTAQLALELVALADFLSGMTQTHLLSLDLPVVVAVDSALRIVSDEVAAEITRTIQMNRFGIY